MMKTRKQNEWDDSYNYGDVGVETQNEFIYIQWLSIRKTITLNSDMMNHLGKSTLRTQ